MLDEGIEHCVKQREMGGYMVEGTELKDNGCMLLYLANMAFHIWGMSADLLPVVKKKDFPNSFPEIIHLEVLCFPQVGKRIKLSL